MSKSKNVHGGGSDTIPEKDKEAEPKFGKDPILAMAEFFDRLDSHRPFKPKVITSFFTGD